MAGFLDSAEPKLQTFSAATQLREREQSRGCRFSASNAALWGEVVFGEYDNDGHLWLYFPKIKPITRITF